MKHCLLFAVTFLLLNSVRAQLLPDSFAVQDPKLFESQMETFMTAAKMEVQENAWKDFKKGITGGTWTPDEYLLLRKTSNAMLGLKLRPNPTFVRFFKIAEQLKKKDGTGRKFREWLTVANGMLADVQNRKVNAFNDFIDFSSDFYEHDVLQYNTGAGLNWSAAAKDYKIAYDNKEPRWVYEQVDLHAYRGKDSMSIMGTSGAYYPVTGIWKGKGGKVTWERFGLKPDELYAVIGEYEITAKMALYEVKDAQLYYPTLLDKTVLKGTLSDKIVAGSRAKESSFPKFESKSDVVKISKLSKNAQFSGGFKLEGLTIYLTKTDAGRAEMLVFDRNNKHIGTSKSNQFIIKDFKRVSAEPAETKLFFSSDSLFHPGISLRFDSDKKHLSLLRGEDAISRTPFTSSLLQMTINTDNIDYYIETDSVVVGRKLTKFTSEAKMSTFESFSYFSEADFIRYQAISDYNPLSTFKVISDKEGTRVLSADLLAYKLNPKWNASNIQSIIYKMVEDGFLQYDPVTKNVTILDKLLHYTEVARGKEDYDYLRIQSRTDTVNAVLNLRQGTLLANGVQNMDFSLKQMVSIKPYFGQILVKKNRDMDFAGKLYAGYSVFEGKDFHFEYEKYGLKLDSIKTWDLFLLSDQIDKKTGKPAALSISSRIENLRGYLQVDAPNNKSGRDSVSIFPSFSSKGNSYVYYDYKGTQNGAYKRDSFFFQLDPFTFNSLDKFVKEDVKFKGVLQSANIFPNIKEPIVIRDEDQSLGFVYKAPTNGLATYQSRGIFKGSVDLSNKGLHGAGNVAYLKSNFDSEDILFLPKQLKATAKKFTNLEDRNSPVQFPKAFGEDVTIDWKPYLDSMFINTKEKPFELFAEGKHLLTGTLILTPGGLRGRGSFDWEEGILTSKLMTFGAFSVKSDTCNFQIKSLDSKDMALDTRNANANLDFDKQEGVVKANSDELTTTLPYVGFQTSMNEFTWDMKNHVLSFKSEANKRDEFMSINKEQDSLSFESKTASYDLQAGELKVGGVEFVQSCDALIYLSDGNMTIRKDGVIDSLKDAKIIASIENKYHTINKATVLVQGKKDFKARGYYEYNVGDKKQEIEFADIVGSRVGKGARSEKATATRAEGTVKEDAGFFVDPKTLFQGTIRLNSESRNLTFDGFAKLDADKLPSKQWFTVRTEADKNDLVLPFNEPKNPEGDPLFTGIFINKESGRAYPAMMSTLFIRKDRPIMNLNGVVKYNKALDEYEFGDSSRVVAKSRDGNVLKFSNKNAQVTALGKFNLGSGLNMVKVDAAGQALTQYVKDSSEYIPGDCALNIEAIFGLKFLIPEKLMKVMNTDLVSASFDAPTVDYLKDLDWYDQALAPFLPDPKLYVSVSETMRNTGLAPWKGSDYTFLLPKVQVKWNSELQSFITTKEKINVASAGFDVINRQYTAYMEVRMPSNEDDRLYFYIKSPAETFYFFGYKQGILSVTSNNPKFMEVLAGMKGKELQIKDKDGNGIEIQAVEENSATQFVSRIKNAL